MDIEAVHKRIEECQTTIDATLSSIETIIGSEDINQEQIMSLLQEVESVVSELESLILMIE